MLAMAKGGVFQSCLKFSESTMGDPQSQSTQSAQAEVPWQWQWRCWLAALAADRELAGARPPGQSAARQHRVGVSALCPATLQDVFF